MGDQHPRLMPRSEFALGKCLARCHGERDLVEIIPNDSTYPTIIMTGSHGARPSATLGMFYSAVNAGASVHCGLDGLSAFVPCSYPEALALAVHLGIPLEDGDI